MPVQTQEPATGYPAPSEPSAAQGNHCVLIVEDDAHSLTVAELYFKRLGIATVSAVNGKEAIEQLKRRHFDLVLMDCRMPEMNGFETTRAIRRGAAGAAAAQVPVVALTAYAMRSDADRCLEAGMNAHLAKPIQLKDLQAMLQKWLPAGLS